MRASRKPRCRPDRRKSNVSHLPTSPNRLAMRTRTESAYACTSNTRAYCVPCGRLVHCSRFCVVDFGVGIPSSISVCCRDQKMSTWQKSISWRSCSASTRAALIARDSSTAEMSWKSVRGLRSPDAAVMTPSSNRQKAIVGKFPPPDCQGTVD